jgi:hypothetical protein
MLRKSIRKSIVAGLAALTLSAAVVSMSTPAEAVFFHGGGGGGWHGGGGWRGRWLARRLLGLRMGLGSRMGLRRLGLPGLGLGRRMRLGADAYFVGDSSYYADNSACWQYRRVWSRPGARGRYLGRYPVNVCG